MKTQIRNITWRFCDSTLNYPQLAGKERLVLQSPDDVYQNFRFLFDDQVRERMVAIWLNSVNRVTGFEVVTEGILNSSLSHPREIFRGAIVSTSAAIILAHNHPSGNAEPSQEDISITKQLVEAGKIIGISVHDHIIFTKDTFTSFAERSLI